tara:strand:- start:92 stop:1282 length:1191 start_codon:yes stop_codon:yes gene_type:complete
MKFKKLGNTELNVSLICLGTMTFGDQVNEENSFKQMDYAIDQGVNFFDTAEMYSSPCSKKSFGRTEMIIGNWIKKRNNREKIILASKISGPGQPWIRGGGLQFTKENIPLAINGSLERLKTDYIDLYQLHWPERNYLGFLNDKKKSDKKYNEINISNFESVLNILKKFVDEGKIRYIGISNETAGGLSKFLELSKLNDLPRVQSIQNAYNLLNRTFEKNLAEISISEKSGLLAYSPLAYGYLTGKYRNNQKPKGSRLELFGDYYTRYSGELSSLAIEKYFNVSQKYKISLAQLSLAFVNQQNFITSNIIGATTMGQLKENIESVDINLNSEIIDELNAIHKENPNPYTQKEKRSFSKKLPSYISTAKKLITRRDWDELFYKFNKIVIKPIKKFFKL